MEKQILNHFFSVLEKGKRRKEKIYIYEGVGERGWERDLKKQVKGQREREREDI